MRALIAPSTRRTRSASARTPRGLAALAAGAPVDSAAIAVDGGMPQHGHGLPTKPRVTRALGNGDHLVEGMKFNMGGWWVVKFRVDAAAGNDSLVFNLQL